MYSVSEVAKIIGVSRQSIYNKIVKEGLHEYLVEGDKGKAITDNVLNFLKALFSEYLDSKPESENKLECDSLHRKNSNTTDNLHDNLHDDIHGVNAMTIEYINIIKSGIEHLKRIISAQAQQSTDLTRLLENSQVLLKHQQEKILLLEKSVQKLNEGKSNWLHRWFN